MTIEDRVYELLAKKVEPFKTKLERREREDDRLKTEDGVFDESTLLTIYHMLNRGVLERVEGNLASGKEANVFLGIGREGGFVVVKIYRVNTTSFRNFTPYIMGDPRFRHVPRDHRALVIMWAKKEFKNLSRMRNGGVRVPEPYIQANNVLIMEYIGSDTSPARTLKETAVADPSEGLSWALKNIELLATGPHLVHSDFSEYNVLVHPDSGERVIIDVAQSVVLDHPSSHEFLVRDVKNICRFFGRPGATVPDEPEAIVKRFLE